MAQKKIAPKQIDLLVGQSRWSTNLVLSDSTSQAVTSFFTGSVSGGTDTTVGVIASAPNNKVYLREAGTGHQLKDEVSGASVFARLTEVSGAWTLSYFVLSNGTEVAYDFTGHPLVGANINFRWCEVVQAANHKPTSIVNAGEGIDQYDASSVSSHHHINDSVVITSNGQTVLTLSQMPKDVNDVILIINSATYNQPESFTVDGTSVTWVATGSAGGFDLEVTDKVTAVYAYAG
jgi:hypothetical protein